MAAEIHRVAVSGGESIVLDWISPAAGMSDTAVFVHGLGSHRRGDKALHFAERFAALGWGFMALDLRGHGESDGTMVQLSLSRCIEDLGAALAWLPNGATPSLLIGSSMGGAVVAWSQALQPRLRCLCAFVAPSFAFPHRLAQELPAEEVAVWRRTGVRRFRSEWLDLEIGWGVMEDAKRYDPGQLLQRYATPSLILHGMHDEAVDWRASVQFLESCTYQNLQLVLIKDGDHRLTAQKSYLFEAMGSWLRMQSALPV